GAVVVLAVLVADAVSAAAFVALAAGLRALGAARPRRLAREVHVDALRALVGLGADRAGLAGVAAACVGLRRRAAVFQARLLRIAERGVGARVAVRARLAFAIGGAVRVEIGARVRDAVAARAVCLREERRVARARADAGARAADLIRRDGRTA